MISSCFLLTDKEKLFRIKRIFNVTRFVFANYSNFSDNKFWRNKTILLIVSFFDIRFVIIYFCASVYHSIILHQFFFAFAMCLCSRVFNNAGEFNGREWNCERGFGLARCKRDIVSREFPDRRFGKGGIWERKLRARNATWNTEFIRIVMFRGACPMDRVLLAHEYLPLFFFIRFLVCRLFIACTLPILRRTSTSISMGLNFSICSFFIFDSLAKIIKQRVEMLQIFFSTLTFIVIFMIIFVFAFSNFTSTGQFRAKLGAQSFHRPFPSFNLLHVSFRPLSSRVSCGCNANKWLRPTSLAFSRFSLPHIWLEAKLPVARYGQDGALIPKLRHALSSASLRRLWHADDGKYSIILS